MTWNEVIEALGQEPEELDFVQEHKRYPVTLQNPVLFLSKIAQKAYDAKICCRALYKYIADTTYLPIPEISRNMGKYKKLILIKLQIIRKHQMKLLLKKVKNRNITKIKYFKWTSTMFGITGNETRNNF